MTQLVYWVQQVEQVKAKNSRSNKHPRNEKIVYIEAEENDQEIDIILNVSKRVRNMVGVKFIEIVVMIYYIWSFCFWQVTKTKLFFDSSKHLHHIIFTF